MAISITAVAQGSDRSYGSDTESYYERAYSEFSESSDRSNQVQEYEEIPWEIPGGEVSETAPYYHQSLWDRFKGHVRSDEGFRFFIAVLSFFSFLLFLRTWRRIARMGLRKNINIETDMKHNVSLPKDLLLHVPVTVLKKETPTEPKETKPERPETTVMLIPDEDPVEENQMPIDVHSEVPSKINDLSYVYGYYGKEKSEEFIRWAYDRIVNSDDFQPKFRERALSCLYGGLITTLKEYERNVDYFRDKELTDEEIESFYKKIEEENGIAHPSE